ncbi:MAG: insulinase family protein [Planctomycetes bacterium]|nr:insulinase family protein [Planctomycetota bacterium]
MSTRKLYFVLAVVLSAGLGCQQLFTPAGQPPAAQSQPAQAQPQAATGPAGQGQPATPASAPQRTPLENAGDHAQPAEPVKTLPDSGSKSGAMPVVSRSTTDDGTIVATLKNGLTVIIKPVGTTPVVSVKAFVRAGAMFEKEYMGCGISHLLEHLVAEGAEQDKARTDSRKADNRIQKIGGQSNASTSNDDVTYYISASSGKTNECIDLVADWMARPGFTEEDFVREHGVVQRELERSEDNPQRQMYQANARAIFGLHPAATPVIGYKAPLAALTFGDVKKFHARMYIPQNMVFCVVGDVNVQAVLERIQAGFANFNAAREVDHTLPEVAPFGGVLRTTLTHPQVKETSEIINFQSISLLHDDLYALDVLSFILSQGASSRLIDRLQRTKKLVTAIDTSSWTPAWGKGAFEITFRCNPELADKGEQAVMDQLKLIAAEGVNEDELARAKKQKVAELVYSQQTVEAIASMLANDYMSTGDVTFSRNYTANIQKVTAEQVRQAAVKYFRFDRMVITRMTPAGKSAAVAATQASVKASQTVTFSLPNGLRVVLGSNNSVGLVSMTLATRGGMLLENKQNNGMGTLMVNLAGKGAGDMNAKQISDFFDNAGGNVSGQCGRNTFLWKASVLHDSFTKAMDVFAEIVLHPTCPAEELDILKPLILSGINRIGQDRNSAAGKFFREKFFGDTPYGLMEVGSKETVEKATAEAIKAYHDKHVLAGDSVLAIYGNFDPQAAKKQIEKIFASMPAGTNKIELPEKRKVAEGGEVYVLPRPGESAATILLGLPGMTINDMADKFAIDVLDDIISGYHMPSGWLHEELRGKQLVYAVHAWNSPGLAPGQFAAMAECQPEKAPMVLEIIRKNLEKASTYTPTQEEIDQAVNVILTTELLDKQEMSDLATVAALDMLYYNRDLRSELENMYRMVTPADVTRVAKKYLSGPFVLTVATSKPELFKPTEKPDAQPPATPQRQD